jgi:hypothetical protein
MQRSREACTVTGVSKVWMQVNVRPNAVSKVKGKVVPVLNLIKHYAMKAYGGVDV